MRKNRTDKTNKTHDHESPPSHGSHAPPKIIPPHGGYEDLLSFQKSRIVFDGTVCFCERFIDKRSRTFDQMVQAARSGKQNILEGSQASGTSKETELKLTDSPGELPAGSADPSAGKGFPETGRAAGANEPRAGDEPSATTPDVFLILETPNCTSKLSPCAHFVLRCC
jgi:hypothetical protein